MMRRARDQIGMIGGEPEDGSPDLRRLGDLRVALRPLHEEHSPAGSQTRGTRSSVSATCSHGAADHALNVVRDNPAQLVRINLDVPSPSRVQISARNSARLPRGSARIIRVSGRAIFRGIPG